MYSSLLSISPPILPLSLLRFALHHDGSKVIAGLLVVRSMGSIAVRPLNRIDIGLIRWTTRYSVKTHVLRLPATAEGGFLRNILHIYKVNDLSFGSSDQGIASRILRPTIRMKGSVESISNSGCDGRWWDQRQPVLDCKRERGPRDEKEVNEVIPIRGQIAASSKNHSSHFYSHPSLNQPPNELGTGRPDK